MNEDERLDLVRTATEAHAELSEIAFKLRRDLGAKDPALKEALKAEERAFRVKRELWRVPWANVSYVSCTQGGLR